MRLSPIHILAAGLFFWILAALWAVGGMPAVLILVLLSEGVALARRLFRVA